MQFTLPWHSGLRRMRALELSPAAEPACRAGSAVQVTKLLQRYLGKFKLAPEFSEDEVEHYLMPVEDVICSYVVEAKGATPGVKGMRSQSMQGLMVTSHTLKAC